MERISAKLILPKIISKTSRGVLRKRQALGSVAALTIPIASDWGVCIGRTVNTGVNYRKLRNWSGYKRQTARVACQVYCVW